MSAYVADEQRDKIGLPAKPYTIWKMKEAVVLLAWNFKIHLLWIYSNTISVKQFSKLPTVTVQPGPNNVSQDIYSNVDI